MRTEPVTVGDLFPADDLVAQWVFSLSAVAEDLSITEAPFQGYSTAIVARSGRVTTSASHCAPV
jgi:hypothetical protein